jgi:hypothetical protein
VPRVGKVRRKPGQAKIDEVVIGEGTEKNVPDGWPSKQSGDAELLRLCARLLLFPRTLAGLLMNKEDPSQKSDKTDCSQKNEHHPPAKTKHEGDG